jgi:hypothetical protein
MPLLTHSLEGRKHRALKSLSATLSIRASIPHGTIELNYVA